LSIFGRKISRLFHLKFDLAFVVQGHGQIFAKTQS
jgi:hypothetical protein